MHRHERARVWLPRHDPLDCRGHLARSDTHTATDSGATLAGDTLAARSPPAALGPWREVPSSRALRDAGLGGRIRARWPSVFLNDSLGSTPPFVEPSAFSQCSTSPTACLCNRDKKERQLLQAHLPEPHQRSRLTLDGLHIIWRDDFKPGQSKVPSPGLVECARGITRGQ